MTDKKMTSSLKPIDIARKSFKQMAAQRIAPTPENYQLIYNQIAGIPGIEPLSEALANALKQLPQDTVGQRKWIHRWEKLLKQNDWAALPALLTEISVDADVESDQFDETFRILQDMLKQSLKYGLIPRLDQHPELKEEAQLLLKRCEKARKPKDWQLVAQNFAAFIVGVDHEDIHEDDVKQDLLRLLKLLIDNISELVMDDQWIRGQIALVQTIMSNPLESAMIRDAEHSLREVIFKQGALKHSLTEAKIAFKNMIATFVDRLGHMSTSSLSYQEKIESFSEKLAETDDIPQINALLETLMKDTYTMQSDIVQSRVDILEQRDQVDATQYKIFKLQEELSQLSEKLSVDQLTGVLNRRGLDEAMVREVSRAHREDAPLCVALLDIDNFKYFNDKYGHHVGDSALQHLARLIQETIRVTDIAARFGGEEFVILLPNTPLDRAVEVIFRLQRALTKEFFLGNNERLLITFSAGVALFKKDEAQEDVLSRADRAMYLAKKVGKNHVKTEFDLLTVKT